jgi:menaquinone-dependent protoporphyrinogen oxidase
MMNETILVTYASCTGSTAEIAESIRNTLSQKGAHVELLRVQDVKDLSPYRAVIVGSPIRKSKWLPEAMQFLRTYRAELAQKRVATFTVCITLAMSTGEQYRKAVREWIAPVRSQVTPISEGLFAGKLDFSRLPWTLDTLLFRITIALGILPKGDRRDWNAIRVWTEGLHSLLLS